MSLLVAVNHLSLSLLTQPLFTSLLSFACAKERSKEKHSRIEGMAALAEISIAIRLWILTLAENHSNHRITITYQIPLAL